MKKLESDDLQLGQFVTVLAWKPLEQTTHGGVFGVAQKIEVGRDDYLGYVLRVLAVDRPFVAVQMYSGCSAGTSISLDTRECDLALLSDEYVDALAPNALRASRRGAS